MFESLPERVEVIEVGPRDGLQNEARVLSTDEKCRLIDALVASGLRSLEATSFVSPQWVPQLADAAEVLAHAKRRGLRVIALVPNGRGYERALQAGAEEVAVVLSVSESHSRKNINRSVSEALEEFVQIGHDAKERGVRMRGYLSTVWGCPFEGEVPIARSVALAERLWALGCSQISLGDTIGVGTPRQTEAILTAMRRVLPKEAIALHLHDTRGTALANVLVGLQMGIAAFDAAIGGLGGCPFAPGAAGNLATEELIYLLEGMGIASGVSLERLLEAGRMAEGLMERSLPGKLLRAEDSRWTTSNAGSWIAPMPPTP